MRKIKTNLAYLVLVVGEIDQRLKLEAGSKVIETFTKDRLLSVISSYLSVN